MIEESIIEKLTLIIEDSQEEMLKVGIPEDKIQDLLKQIQAEDGAHNPTQKSWLILKFFLPYEKNLSNRVKRGENHHKKKLFDIRHSIQFIGSACLNDGLASDEVLEETEFNEIVNWLKKTNPEDHNPDFPITLEKDPNNPIAYVINENLRHGSAHFLEFFIQKTQDYDLSLVKDSGLFNLKPGTRQLVLDALVELLEHQPQYLDPISSFLEPQDLKALTKLLSHGDETVDSIFQAFMFKPNI